MCDGIVKPRCDEAWQHVGGYSNIHSNKHRSSRHPYEFHEYPFHEIHVGVWFAVTCRRIIGLLFLIENLNIERFVNFILRHTLKEVTEDETLLQTWRRYNSHHKSVAASTNLMKLSGEHATRMNQWPQPSPHLNPCYSYFLDMLTGTMYIKNSRVSSNISQEVTVEHIAVCWRDLNVVSKQRVI